MFKRLRPIFSLANLIALASWQGRGLFSGLILGILAGSGARFFATASLGQDTRVLVDLLLAGTTIGSLVITWYLAGNLTSQEQDRGTGLLLVSKPLSASQYVTGRWLGLVLGGGVIFLLSSLVGLLIASWHNTLPVADILLSWLVSGGELLVLVALSNFMACWTTPTLANLLTLGFWICGHSLDILILSTGWQWLSYLLPNLSRFSLHETYVQALSLPLSYYLLTLLYALIWTAVLTGLASATVRRRSW